MIVLNLFIGVIMNSMDEVRNEQILEEKLRQEQGPRAFGGGYRIVLGDSQRILD